MKIEGIAIQIIAGPYVYPEDVETPAYIDPVYVENGEINIGNMNKVPILETESMARQIARKIQLNHERKKKHGIKGDRSGQH